MSTPHRRWGLWVLVLLLVPGAMWASGVRPNELPGNATTSPSWDPGRLLDDDYYREIDTWLADRTPSQDAGLWARYQLDYRLLGDASNQAVALPIPLPPPDTQIRCPASRLSRNTVACVAKSLLDIEFVILNLISSVIADP